MFDIDVDAYTDDGEHRRSLNEWVTTIAFKSISVDIEQWKEKGNYAEQLSQSIPSKTDYMMHLAAFCYFYKISMEKFHELC